MLNKRLILLAILTLLCLNNTQAQQRYDKSDDLRPRWIKFGNASLSENVELVAISMLTTHRTLNHNTALGVLTENLPLTWKVQSIVETRDSGHNKYSQNGLEESEHIQSFDIQVFTESEPANIKCQLIDEYWELIPTPNGNMYQFFQLYQVAKPNHRGSLYEIGLSSHYGFEAGWRSAVVPGWGQFHKGDYKKGMLMLGGSVALAGGIVLTEATRADYKQKYGLTHDLAARKAYLNRHNHWQLARNICIGALAGFYIYNIVDAFNTPGARYVIVRHKDSNGRTYAFAPTMTPEGYPAAAAAIAF